MPIPTLNRLAARVAGQLSLRIVLIVPFVVQIVGTVGSVGYFSFKSGQNAVENLAQQLMEQVGERISDRLTTYLQAPQNAVAVNRLAVEQGILNLNDFEQLQQHLWQQMALNPSLEAIFFANEPGEEIGYGRFQSEELVQKMEKLAGEDLSIGMPYFNINKSTDPGKRKYYLVDAKGNPRKLLYPFPIDNRTAPWYRAAKAAKQRTWSPVSVYKVVPSLGIFALAPLYNTAGKWQGTFVSNFSLSAISTFLEKLHFSPSGQIFIMERSGNLVATSMLEIPFAKQALGKPTRLLAVNSKDTRTRDIARQLTQKFGNFHTLHTTQQLNLVSNHERQFVRVTPYQDKYGLDWLVVVIVPELDFMEQIHANNRITILLCIGALFGSIGIGILSTSWITKPILRLNTTARDIAKGEWDKPIEIERIDEVGELANSFKTMAAHLQHSFAELQSLNAALAQRENQLRQFFDAIPVGVSIHEATGKVLYFNQVAKHLLGIESIPDAANEEFAQVYQLYRQNQLYPTEELPALRALKGETVFVDDIELHRDGEIIPCEIRSTPIFDEQGNIIYAIGAFADITQRKQAEQVLAKYNHTLETQVADRTAKLAHANEQLRFEIAERKLLEGKLYSSTQQVRTIFESITDIVLIIDEKKNIQVIPTKAIGWDACDTNWLNSIVQPFFQEDTAEIWFAKVQQVVETQQNINFDYSLRIDNREVWFSACISPLPDNSVVWVARDISDAYRQAAQRKIAEQALIESEARFQAFMNNSPLLAWITDGNGTLLYCNRSIELWYDRAASELIGEMIEVLHPPNIAQQHLENIRYVINTRQVLETNESAFSPDGTLHEFLIYKFPLIDAKGQCLVGGIAADITDLEKSEERLQLILDASDLGLWDWNIATGQTYFDPSWKKMLGYEVDEIENSYQSWVKLLHPEDFPRISEALIGYLEGRLPIYEVELRMLTKSGDWKWILGHGKVSERDASGKPLRMIGTQKDIHARKLAEEALRESKEQLQLALEGSGDGFWDWNIQTGEVYLSPRYLEMLGYEADELPQEFSTWDRLIHPDDKPWVMETLNAHFADSSVPYKFDYRVLTKSGESKWIANYGKVVARDENGAPLRMTGTHRDVSDKKLTEIKLQQAVTSAEAANRAKSQFLANMSHELRTPLNGILGYAQILQRDKNATPKQKEGVDIIYQCGTHLLTLINDILDLSKIEAGKLELYPEDIHFSSFLAGVSEIFQLKAAQKEIHFTYLPLTQLPTGIHADEKRLRQVLMNLLSNAVKFTDTGSVTFKVEVISHQSLVNEQELRTNDQELKTNAKIRFQVEDTGIGMSREELEKIFLSFEQVGDNSRRAEGTGLGLAISQKIVERMGSQIFVESTPGVGSTFWFDLDVPEALTSTQPMSVKLTDNIIGYSGSKRKILVVDDRWENCAVIINMLEPIGFELFEATNGQEGLEKAVECKPDLILVDLVMPVMDGHQMTRQLRQLPAFQDTIIIAISAHAFEADRQQSRESGCNDFLPKPVQSKELLNKIKTYLNLSWSYDDVGRRTQKSDHSSQMVIPPPEELVALYEAACSGDIEGVEREGIRLQELSSEYILFAIRVLELAQAFEYEEIATLVDHYLSKDSK
jgi:PAS domain S-box-containing protein